MAVPTAICGSEKASWDRDTNSSDEISSWSSPIHVYR